MSYRLNRHPKQMKAFSEADVPTGGVKLHRVVKQICSTRGSRVDFQCLSYSTSEIHLSPL